MAPTNEGTKYTRFETEEQRRIRETALLAWYVDRILEDRAETAQPPLELIGVAGHG